MILQKMLTTSFVGLFTLGAAYADTAVMLAAPTIHAKTIYASRFLTNGPDFSQSTDNCKTWKPGPMLGLPPETTVSLGGAISDAQGNVYNVFAAVNPVSNAEDKVFKLPAGQSRWQEMPSAGLPDGWQISGMAIDQQGNLYAGAVSNDLQHTGIFTLPQGTKTWVQKPAVNIAADGSVQLVMALVTNNAGDLYAAIANGGIFKLAKGSTSWTPLNNGLPPSTTTSAFLANQLLLDANNNLYVATDMGVFKLPQGSDTWVAESQGLEAAIAAEQASMTAGEPVPFVLQLNSQGMLYAETPLGIYQLQGDNTWVSIPVAKTIPSDIYAFAITADDQLCVTTDKGMSSQK